MIQTFTNRLSDIILRPKLFFDDMEHTGGYYEPLFFSFFVFLPVTITGIILYLCGLPQMIVIAEVTKSVEGNQLFSIFLIRAFAWGCGLFLMAGLYHIGFKMVGGTGNFEVTYRIVAYTSATYVFNLIPRVGIIIYCFYSLYLVILGGRAGHKITGGKAIIGPLIPMFFIMVVSFLIQSFIPMN